MLQLAIGMAGVVMNDPAVELSLLVIDDVKRMGGSFDLKRASELRAFIEGKYFKTDKNERPKGNKD
jgi:predicted SpoU family rRNA methylase